MIKMTVDGNTAASYVAYAFSELAIIYPITPSSPMAELVDEWSTSGKENLFGSPTKVVQMQSESGAAGALHGSLTCGALATTFTCSQGLLLMIPNMYKIAGELLPTVFHVSARALATHALSIFGDHQDVMACRQTGFAMLASASVQEAADMALIAHLATLRTSVPFLHFFDGFRTSHETVNIELPTYEEMRGLVDYQNIQTYKKRALTPDSPTQRGTAQNSDVYFQNREAANVYYTDLSKTVQSVMHAVAKVTGRDYRLFDYYGATDAEYVAILMGSGFYTMKETVEKLCREGQKFGVIAVRLYRPFDASALGAALPQTCKRVCVLDRTKEPGACGEPLYLDVCGALRELDRTHIEVIGGRYGLGSKEFSPAMCYAVLQNLTLPAPKNHFTVGIYDDVTHTSLDTPELYDVGSEKYTSCIFYGLGSDGTVGANKNSIKIIGDYTSKYVQAYFCYDSRKSGGATVSHLRFGEQPILSPYLIERADFVACHNPSYVHRFDMLSKLKEGGVFLLNSPWQDLEALEENLPALIRREIAHKNVQFYCIDGTKIANDVGLNGRSSIVMQAAFFLLNQGLMPYERAIEYLKAALSKKFAKKGESIVMANLEAVNRVRESLKKIEYPCEWKNAFESVFNAPKRENLYYKNVMHPILTLHGDELPVSAFPPDGTYPTGTTKYEKHGTAFLLPQWIMENCIQCNQCSFTCPHATIRPFLIPKDTALPTSFAAKPTIQKPDTLFRIQVAASDCMGCGVCANVCPAKEKALVMREASEMIETESKNWEFAQSLPVVDPTPFKKTTVKGSQFAPPLFEFSYACAGCGETAYIKVLTQLFGERMLIANATGCSSIYGGSSPACPYTVTRDGKGPAWANSLFEDNAEFGLGMRLACNLDGGIGKEKSVWIIGGDGWAYDIGFGGLDHVLASGENVNILVLDSEVYSNTGGQASKSTPTGAVARFAAAGKRLPKKPLALMAMAYGYVYVAQVAIGADKQQFLNAVTEAENYDGPSIIIAYSPCIAHGLPMSQSVEEEKRAVQSGYWDLFRFNPALIQENKNPFILDSKVPTADFEAFLMRENRFAALKNTNPARAEELFKKAEKQRRNQRAFYEKLATLFQKE